MKSHGEYEIAAFNIKKTKVIASYKIGFGFNINIDGEEYACSSEQIGEMYRYIVIILNINIDLMPDTFFLDMGEYLLSLKEIKEETNNNMEKVVLQKELNMDGNREVVCLVGNSNICLSRSCNDVHDKEKCIVLRCYFENDTLVILSIFKRRIYKYINKNTRLIYRRIVNMKIRILLSIRNTWGVVKWKLKTK